MKLRRTLAKLVGGAHDEAPEEEVPTETHPEEAEAPAQSAGPPSGGGLAITFTLVERPRDEQ
jgi:hypothetical protein